MVTGRFIKPAVFHVEIEPLALFLPAVILDLSATGAMYGCGKQRAAWRRGSPASTARNGRFALRSRAAETLSNAAVAMHFLAVGHVGHVGRSS